MGALQFAGEELKADVAGLELLCEAGEFDAAAEALVLVDDEGDRDTGGADLGGEPEGGFQFGALESPGGDLLGENPGDPGGGEGVARFPRNTR
jgi:hypothetical protein